MEHYIRRIFRLNPDLQTKERTVTEISSNITFTGYLLWTLILAIFLASIGLNTNSTAVIIGDMLISPQMGPIVGAGLALGINDFNLFKRSFRSLLTATLISILVSTLYFLTSPVSEVQSELLARTSPNIYDVLIAFFGGLAGIAGTSHGEKGNLLAGVAIATALMPPLCTVGFGIATGKPAFIFGAFYLYLINCTFICLSTFLAVKYLKFSNIQILDASLHNRIHRGIGGIVILNTLPALYFAWQL
jgi:uncharacterized hydrophobic protein (TIGR00271 family)